MLLLLFYGVLLLVFIMMPPSSSSVTAVAAVGGAGEGGEAKICINTCCKETIKSDGVSTRKKGWRLRSGEDADLCDRCLYAPFIWVLI